MPGDVAGGEAAVRGGVVSTATARTELPRRHVLERYGLYVVRLLADRGTERRDVLGAVNVLGWVSPGFPTSREIPITCFEDRPGHQRPLQPCA